MLMAKFNGWIGVPLARKFKRFRVTIDPNYLRSAALRRNVAIEALIATDVEHRGALQIIRDTQTRKAMGRIHHPFFGI